ncbi:MAG: ASKHA domain-containing protein [Candidatus Latescibacterota bacterium]
MAKFEVRFQPDGLRIVVEAGTRITDAIQSLGIRAQLPCGGTGKCGKCTVQIHPDPPEPGPFDRRHLTPEEIGRGIRLACRTRVDRPMSVLLTPGIRVLGGQILVDGLERSFALEPSIEKTFLELPEPSLQDQAADLLRVVRGMGRNGDRCPKFDIDLLRELPHILRDSGFRVTVVTSDGSVVGVEPGDTGERKYGIAFDLGTTTVVGTILDLATGRELAHASRLNPQVVYGEDTISRIRFVIENNSGRNDLTREIRRAVNEIVTEASVRAGVNPYEIYEAVFVGNTTMSHLFIGLDPSGLAQIPFVPVTCAPVNLRAMDAGIEINPWGNLHVLPNIAGFVGSDTVGVMLACNYLEPGPAQLAVDVGTNGELALRKGDTLMVCSTAAGPALEGAALSCGMRAANGAIEHVRITETAVECDVIGDIPPVGICGSGIIDIVAELLDRGIVDSYGRLLEREEIKGMIPDYLLDHIIEVDSQPAFLLAGAVDQGGPERNVAITQRDIRQIQLAKGAISAGIGLILKEMGVALDDLDQILLAGAFGNYIRKRSALRIGLLPPVPGERIRFVGNAASTGAKMALLSRSVREDADRIRGGTKHLELAALPDFMNVFMDHMLFP